METNKKDAAIKFFEEALAKWNDFIELLNQVHLKTATQNTINQAEKILGWLQDNYSHYSGFSDFKMYTTNDNGERVEVDPLFDVLFRGCTFTNIVRNFEEYFPELQQVHPQLRGHLSSITKAKKQNNDEKPEMKLDKLLKTLSRFHIAIISLTKRRKGKTPFVIADEYDVQDLLYSFLKLEFDDVRKEEFTPSYAGGASKIDFVLKNEKIIVETKKTSDTLTTNKIGEQLIIDIAKYENYPEIDTLVCFIYDPDYLIENSEGLKLDLEKKSTKKLKVIVIVSPKTIS
jgi:hypothetical protein